MTRDEIIEMAKQANAGMLHGGGYSLFGTDAIERFAKLVAQQAQAEEREACAKVCEDDFGNGALNLATAIRARGDNK